MDEYDEPEEQDVAPKQKVEQNTLKVAPKQHVTQEEMINITSCDYREFSNFMRATYGVSAFEKGFKVIKDNFDLIHSEDGEDQLAMMLSALFSDNDSTKGFINFVTTYLIVQNMNFGK